MNTITSFGLALCIALTACGESDKKNGGSTTDGSGGSGGGSSSGGSGTSSSSSGGSSNSGGSSSGGSSSTSTGGTSANGGGAGAETTDATGGTSSTDGGGGVPAAGGMAGMGGDGSMGGEGGAPDCSFGEAQNPAAPGSLDLFGQISYYADGATLPAGHYRVTYIDGCMKYASTQDWSIHAYDNTSFGWFLGATSGDIVVRLPGTVGYIQGQGGFSDFAACVAANQLLDPVEFDFAGGQLGIWLADSNYPDNVPGLDGNNPVWKLERLGGCGDE